MSAHDLIEGAFGEWRPSEDATAALKFCLNAILVDGDFDWLVDILQPAQSLQFQGEPGWELERKLDTSSGGGWPAGIEFRVSVPLGLVGIEKDEVFIDFPTFMSTLGPLLDEYKKRAPTDNEAFLELVHVFQAQSQPPSSPS